MHPCFRTFIRQYVVAVVGALVPVVLTTFLSLPMRLGPFRGDQQSAGAAVERHLT